MFLDVVADHRILFLVIGSLGLLASGGYLVWRFTSDPAKPAAAPAKAAVPTTPRPAPPRPASRPPTGPLPVRPKPASLDAGIAGHQKAGNAQTVKLATQPSKIDPNLIPTEPVAATKPAQVSPAIAAAAAPAADDADRDALFAGLGGGAGEGSQDVVRKAERMSELNFHHGTGKDSGARAAADAAAAPAAATPAVTTGEPPKNRSQTAELDDILSRIDKVLAENPVMATNTIASAEETAALAKADEARKAAQTEPPPAGGQQKLF